MRMLLATLAGILFAGCATAYQPIGFTGGYSERQLSRGKWLVQFDGNGFTSESAAYSGAMRRANEVCGGDFDVVSERTSSAESQYGSDGIDCHRFGNNISCDERHASVARKPTTVLTVRCVQAH